MTNGRYIKSLVLLNAIIPMGFLLWDATHHALGANPVNFAIKTTGLLGLIFLILSLAITPLRALFNQPLFIAPRRILGLAGFFYILIHFAIYFWWDQAHDIAHTFNEVISRIYLTIGMAALLMMVPLAVTSTDAMITRLGPARWKVLHRLAYPIAILGVIHFYMQAKADKFYPLVFGSVLALFLAYRYVAALISPNGKNKPPAFSPTHNSQLPTRNPAPRQFKGSLRVVRTVNESPDVRTIRLAPSDGKDLPFTYLPGQYLNITLDVDGKPMRRSYSISSSPTQTAYCEISVKNEMNGRVSPHLHRAVKEGDLLQVTAPAGKLTFTGTEAPAIGLLGAGVGMTPLISVVRYLTDHAWKGDIVLICSARHEHGLLFRADLTALAARHPNLKVFSTLTSPPAGWTGTQGRISRDLLSHIPRNARVHLCGPTAMMQAARISLRELGLPDTQIFEEEFISPTGEVDPTAESIPVPTPTETTSATFTTSHRTIEVPPNATLLETAEANGLTIPYDCRAGICGQCKLHLSSGKVRMDATDALSKTDRAKNIILACQAHALTDITVDA